MAKKYFRGWVGYPVENALPKVTEKALGFTVAGGYTCANDTITYFPKSQVIFGEKLTTGWVEVLIPYWLMKQKSRNAVDFFERLREVHSENGENYIIER